MARVLSYLGVDLGGGGIKIVELAKEESRSRLMTYAWVERSPLEQNVDWLTEVDRTAEILRAMVSEAGVRTRSVIAGLPLYSVFTTVLSLAGVPEKELSGAVSWETKKLLPFSLDEAILDWRVLPSPTGSSDAQKKNVTEVMVTAARKSERDKYVAVFQKAGLTLASLETEGLGFIRALIGTDMSPAIIIDIGSRKSNILIVDRGAPFLAHSVEVGGSQLTEAIAQVMHIAADKAEGVKFDMASVPRPEGLPQVIKDALNPLKNAIQYALSLYKGKSNAARMPEKMVLTGGSSVLLGLPEYLTSVFNIRTFLGDPWARVLYADELKPTLQEIGPRFSVAIGLAQRMMN